MNLRIGVLTTSFPRFDGDPAGPFVLHLGQALAGRGHEVEVLAPEPQTGAPPTFDQVSVRWIPYLRPRSLQRTFYDGGAVDRALSDWRTWPGLATYPAALAVAARQRRHGWDALISHWALPCGLAAAVVRERRPHVAVFHSADVWALRRLPASISKAVVHGSTAMWFVCRASADEIRARTGIERPTLVAPMPAEDPYGRTTDVRTLSKNEPIRVLFVGRLVAIKGVDIAIQAATRCPTEIVLTVAGDGPERARLEAVAPPNVRFTGSVDAMRRNALLQWADVVVLPSRTLRGGRAEGVPVVALEAAAHGVPVVASRSGGLSSLSRWAKLVPSENVDALRAALLELRSDYAERFELRHRGLEFSSENRWSKRANDVERMLQSGATAECSVPRAAGEIESSTLRPVDSTPGWRSRTGFDFRSRR